VGPATREEAVPGRGAEAEGVRRAPEEATARCHDAVRASPGFSYPDAWLAWSVNAIAYDAPSGTNTGGFATAG